MDGIIDNLTSALNTWNSKLAEIWLLLTESPETFKGGDIWKVILKVHDALQAIGLALLVLFFVWGLIKTCTSWQDVKRPEQAFKLFLRFIIARTLVLYGMELMTKIFEIVQGIIQSITETVGLGVSNETVIPQEIVDAVSNTGFLESIPLWAVTLLGSIFITILSFVMILTVYGRFFKLYMYTAISPVPLAAAAGERVIIQNIIPQHLESLISKLKEMGVKMENVGDSIIVYGDNKNFNAVDVRTQVYPGFATDLQQPLTALLTQANGQSQVIETIYPERFRHCEQLNKMGANIELDESMCYINGKTPLKGAKVEATDLRCGAALLIAGLIADGITEISNVYHIDRGYANIDQKLITLGAVIRRIKVDD